MTASVKWNFGDRLRVNALLCAAVMDPLHSACENPDPMMVPHNRVQITLMFLIVLMMNSANLLLVKRQWGGGVNGYHG